MRGAARKGGPYRESNADYRGSIPARARETISLDFSQPIEHFTVLVDETRNLGSFVVENI